MKTSRCCTVRVLAVSLLTTCAGCDHARSWGWKLATDADDVMNFLNGRVSSPRQSRQDHRDLDGNLR